MTQFKLKTPLTEKNILSLKAGDEILLSGIIYGARDAAHKKIIKSIENNENLPFELNGSVIFYVGPSPVPPGRKSGAVGPTTSARMDNLTEPLLKKGLKGIIGKGDRSRYARELLKRYKCIYFIAPGGISAILASKIKEIKEIAYHDLGPEALFEIEIKDFPLFVAYDLQGNNIFELALRRE
ncbi:MAG: FumA C-terminus/TtdB family hydratase beta subunit [Actinomycetota bacterium]|nr:FumA C-terminus/TtdB family hydratase beta subunit [Actinomycetota bacterium]